MSEELKEELPEVSIDTSAAKNNTKSVRAPKTLQSSQVAALSAQIAELQKTVDKIKSKLFWMTMMGYLKLAVLIIPIIISIIYLPSLISQYSELFKGFGDAASLMGTFQETLNLVR